jgi:hypothetical protein
MKSTRHHSVTARREQLLRSIPDVGDYRSLLYIGANVERMEMLDLFIEKGYRIDILEAWPENLAGLVEWAVSNGVTIQHFIEGDVRTFDREKAYDVVMWWHGPEHVTKEELPNVLHRLELAARHLVVLACPSGLSPQDEVYGNPFERHSATLYATDMRDFNYKINILGKTDKPNSNLISWKRVSFRVNTLGKDNRPKMKSELTIMPTGACNMDCPHCSQRTWRADYRDYQMSMDEVKTICRRAGELGLHYERLYITGGEPTLWANFEEACRYAKASGVFSSIWVSSNCVEVERLSRALDARLIDKVCTQISNASIPGVESLQRKYGIKVAVSQYRTIHKPLPITPLEHVLPARCGCDRLVVFESRIYPCAGAYPHMKRLGLDMDDPRVWAGVDENWPEFFRGKNRLNQTACRVCVANRNVWDRIAAP